MSALATVPGYVAGTWAIDPVNSEVGFTVRYLGVSRVHGRFNKVTGTIVTAETAGLSSVSATVAAASIDTSFPGRDTYIRGSDILAADEHQNLSFCSAGVRAAGDGYLVDGDLTIRGITRPVTLAVDLGGFADDPTGGGTVAGFSATATITRTDFGFSEKIPPAIIGDKVDIYLDIQAVLAT